MSDMPSQYTEDIETFRQIIILPDPRDSICLGPLPQSGLRMMQKANRILGQGALQLCSHSVLI